MVGIGQFPRAAGLALEVGQETGDRGRLHLSDNLVEGEQGVLAGGGLAELGHAVLEEGAGGVGLGGG
jgi:hypothetical protein